MRPEPRVLRSAACLLWAGLLPCALAQAETNAAANDTLVIVGEEAVLGADLDAVIRAKHAAGQMADLDNAQLARMLEKSVHDRLLGQDARAMGLDEEPEVAAALAAVAYRHAVSAFVADAYAPPAPAAADEVRAEFEKYYWKIQFRQISVATPEEAEALAVAIGAGADMDSLARAVSLDTHRREGGLRKLLFWRDVDPVLRPVCRDLAAGELSPPFPFRDRWALLRVERRQAPKEEDFMRVERSILSFFYDRDYEVAWAGFLDSLATVTPVTVDEAVLADIRADSSQVYRGDFRVPDARPALTIDADLIATGEALRRSISKHAMRMGTAPFESILAAGLSAERERLLLTGGARRGGYGDDDETRRAIADESRDLLVEAYLNAVVVPRITFSRDEFQTFYEEHREDWRQPGEIKLSLLMIPDEETARDAARRLREGSDFDYLRKQLDPGGNSSSDEGEWAAETVFSDAMRSAFAELGPGETSEAVKTVTGWLVLRVDDRRQGAVPALSEVEMQIRQVMFQRKFNEILDEVLGLLEERSHVEYVQESIDAYFGIEN